MTDDSNKVNNIDGISFVNIKDVVAPVYSYFNLNIGDEQIMDKASEYVEELASSDNLAAVSPNFMIEPLPNCLSICSMANSTTFSFSVAILTYLKIN